jgi:hypothetical protein
MFMPVNVNQFVCTECRSLFFGMEDVKNKFSCIRIVKSCRCGCNSI